MNFFANSVLSHVKKLVGRHQHGNSKGHSIIIMIPAMPAKHILDISTAISNFCSTLHHAELVLKIAKFLTDDWSPQDNIIARGNDWHDERGNLAFYRSLPGRPDRFTIKVLCGADKVTDSASLADFHTCGLDTIWNREMRRSFKGWISSKLISVGLEDFEVSDLKSFDRILKPLLEHGRGDLLRISDWLDAQDLTVVYDISSVQDIFLTSLSDFNLPSFSGFPIKRKNKSLGPYIDKATSFFNYTFFLDDTKRSRTSNNVGKLLEAYQKGESQIPLDDPDICGPYQTGDNLLSGLIDYISNDSQDDRTKLYQCDFVTISDKILKFRTKGRPSPPSTRKITGGPVEMLLTATWHTLKDYCKVRGNLDYAQITDIEIETVYFKHDIEEQGDDADGLDRNELARDYLAKLIGGIDQLAANHIILSDATDNQIRVASSLVKEDVSCKYSKTAEPQLVFSISIIDTRSDDPFKRQFAWRLPEHHVYRLSFALIQKANQAINSHPSSWKLPVFHLSYYEEILRSLADEEIRRVLLHCIRDERTDDHFLTNLLSKDWIETNDHLLKDFNLLADRYQKFIKLSAEKGILASLHTGSGPTVEWNELANAFRIACNNISEEKTGISSPLSGMLLRAFLILAKRKMDFSSWYAEKYEQSGIVTVLHPALLEMLEAQSVYLFNSFNYAANKEMKNSSPAFRLNIWRTYIDLASIHAPVSGLLYNEDKNLDANIRGQDLIHMLGSPPSGDGSLSTRLLLNYDSGSEEDFKDVEMFKESSESKLLQRLMIDYLHLHPHAKDGLSIAIYRNKDIQPVIAAVHHYLRELADPKSVHFVLKEDRERPYFVSLTILTSSGDDSDVSRWIEQWKERWEASESIKSHSHYRNCRFAVAHRLVENKDQGLFKKLILQNFDADIAVFYDFIGAGSGVNRFEKVDGFDITSFYQKFPILEKACCTIKNPADQYKRARIISNRQFTLSSAHARLMHALRNEEPQTGTVVVGNGDYQPWAPVIDALHSKTEWVVCIDPNIDELLIKKPVTEQFEEREIIGFGSGVGPHGEDNFTISTQQFSLNDIKIRLTASVQELFAELGWSIDDCQKVTRGVLRVASEISGLSLVRATGANDNYIRDFMAYALVRKILKQEDSILCDTLISLDAYRHWFDLADNSSKPDLIRLRARLGKDERLHIDMHLIECKLGKRSEALLSKARSQINNGLKVLTPAFCPLGAERNEAEIGAPDQRYWWMQLHRLIASRTVIDKGQQMQVLTALERLAEGDYNISWDASVFAFWIDAHEDGVQHIGSWNPPSQENLTAKIFSMGNSFIMQIADDDRYTPTPWEEIEKSVSIASENVCDVLDDSVSLIGDDDDADVATWEDEASNDEETNFSDQSKYEEEQLNGQTESEAFGDLKVLVVKDQIQKEQSSNEKNNGNAEKEIPPNIGQIESVVETESPGHLRILLGATIPGGKPIHWEFGHQGLENRHLLIFGKSGVGKTYAIQCLLNEMGRLRQNSLIVDYTDGFLPNHLEEVTNAVLRPKQHIIQHKPLPINPFIPQTSDAGGIPIKENANAVAKRIASIFESVYKIGDQQYSVLHEVLMEGVELYGLNMSLDKMLKLIEDRIEDKRQKANAQTLFSKIRPFILDNPFDEGKDDLSWRTLFQDQDNLCHIFQLVGLDKLTRVIVTEFVLWNLYAYLQAYGNKNNPKVIVLDEVQNLDMRDGSPLSKYLVEGRKFGVSLILATQIMSNMKKEERDRMFNAAHRLFFRPADTEIKSFATIAASTTRQSTDEWVRRLASLGKGECYSMGPTWNEKTEKLLFNDHRIKISSLEDRGFNG